MKKSQTLKTALLVSAAWLALAGAAMAQTATPPPPTQTQPQTETQDEEIVVTGTRVVRPDYAYSNPVTSVTSEAIQLSGATNLTDFLQEIPALGNSLDANDSAGSNAFIGGTGLNLLNLRNLGIDRTLVLVNGRRHVASVPGSAAIDTNTIPVDLIERVDVLTGGASAVYGADGVSGVVNFILDDNFEGWKVRGQYGTPSDYGGGSQSFLSVVGGRNFAGGRGNIAGAVEYSLENRLRAYDRDFASTNEVRFVRNPNDPLDDPNIPDFIPMGDLRWFESGRGGAVDINADFGADYDGNTDAPWDPGNFPGGIQSFTYAQGGSATPVGGYSGDLLPREERWAVNLFGHYDLTNQIRLFSELKYVRTTSLTYSQPTFDFFLWIDEDNPFIPPNIAAAHAIADPGDPLLVTRDNFDLGVRGEDVLRETFRSVVGAEGDLTDWLKYNASFTWGVTNVENTIRNNRYNDRFAAALDVVDPDGAGPLGPTCRSNIDPLAEPPNVSFQGFAPPTSFTPGPNSGCQPLNIFGEGSPSQAAIDWVMTDSLDTSQVTQQVASAYLSGNADPWFTLPGGSIGYAIGAEWRRESADDNPAQEDQLGLTFGNQIQPTHGHYEVKEAYAELSLPILQHAPFADSLSLDLAGRWSEYSTIGETTTWKAGAVWAPISDITFRATHARAVRAPNIGELFSPSSQTFLFVTDPCDVNNLGFGTANRAANCAALLAPLGADPATFTDPNIGVSIPGTAIGNPTLQEETADTDTIGIIVRPHWYENLVFAVDYYDIDIQNAVNSLDPQDLADQCVDLPTINNQFCNAIVRQNGGTGAGGIIDFTTQPVNVAAFTTRGYDFSVSLRVPGEDLGDPNLGDFNIRLIGNKLDDLAFVNLPGANPDPDLGEANAPEWQVNFDLTWQRGPWTVNYGFNWFSETQRFTLAQRAAQPDISDPQYLDYSDRFTHDIQLRRDFGEHTQLYFGINNFGNQKPDLGATFYPVSAVGAFYYVGFNYRRQ